MPSLGTATGIREGQLPVAWTGQEEKVTFLEVAPRPIPASRLALTLAVDTDGNNHAVAGAEIVACAVTEPWESGSPMAWDHQPSRNCEDPAPGVYQAATNDFFFDLSPLLPALATTGCHGVVLAPAPAATSPVFQVVFQSATGGGATIDYHARPEGGGADPDDPTPPPLSASRANRAAPPVEIDRLSRTRDPGPIPVSAAQESRTGTSPRPLRQERQASFGGFYAGMAALAILLATRPVVPALSHLLRAGTGDELSPVRSQRRPWRRE